MNQLLGGVLRLGGKPEQGRMIYRVQFGVMCFDGLKPDGTPNTVYNFDDNMVINWDPGKNKTFILIADPYGNGQLQFAEVEGQPAQPQIIVPEIIVPGKGRG